MLSCTVAPPQPTRPSPAASHSAWRSSPSPADSFVSSSCHHRSWQYPHFPRTLLDCRDAVTDDHPHHHQRRGRWDSYLSHRRGSAPGMPESGDLRRKRAEELIEGRLKVWVWTVACLAALNLLQNVKDEGDTLKKIGVFIIILLLEWLHLPKAQE